MHTCGCVERPVLNVDLLGLEAKSRLENRQMKIILVPINLETIRPISGVLLAIYEMACCQLKLAHVNWKFAIVPKRHYGGSNMRFSEHHGKTAKLTPRKLHTTVLEIHRRIV